MGRIKVEDHESLRKWCAENQVSDPEDLVARNKDGSIVFRSANSGKSYRRIETMYRDAREPVVS
ncbi:Uncharacterised protein [uncultured archaeon]|nr:Uncharacterised protein [uncultured archaeon]